MSRRLTEYPGDTGETPEALLAVRYVTAWMGIGTQQAVGRMAYALAHVHRALVKGQTDWARFLTLITLSCIDQQTLDLNWGTAWTLMPVDQPPWDHWKTIDLSERRRSFMHSPLYDPQWVSLAAAKAKEEETLLKRRSDNAKSKFPQREPKAGGRGGGEQPNG